MGMHVFKLVYINVLARGRQINCLPRHHAAATAISGDSAVFALQIALVHLIYNSSAVLLIYGVKNLRKIPIRGALWIARVATERKTLALLYILGVFFGLPAILIFITNQF